MLSVWPIRRKLWLGIGLLLLSVAILAFSGFRGVYAFRSLARSISRRATEIPIAVALAQHTSALETTIQPNRLEASFHLQSPSSDTPIADELLMLDFRSHLAKVSETLQLYRDELAANQETQDEIGNVRDELATAGLMEESLLTIHHLIEDDSWSFQDKPFRDSLAAEVGKLNTLSAKLPSFLQARMFDFQGDVRGQYRTWILLAWVTSVSAAILLLVMVRLLYGWIFEPLETIIAGSRIVAGGRFGHRITLKSQDEMAELATAMNNMTQRFQEIRDDLNQQVKERTKEVVRSEQLASVGYLAAGVAHEINNPLASIALCAESLEERLADILQEAAAAKTNDRSDEDEAFSANQDPASESEVDVLKDYLGMIQDEAFRCKQITERLLDFSRLGDVEKQTTDLCDLVSGVIDMIRHVGKYKEKQVQFDHNDSLYLPTNSQEMKQVILNLITNGLDSLDPGGTVWVNVWADHNWAYLTVRDDGCGMTSEVKEHIFEPFFTRRRDGQGTGLGMSISFRIVSDHGGQIDVHSDGPGCGSTFTVKLPRNYNETKNLENLYAA
ncbi:MAG: HAMP domain-containing histidine kinase [Planctomycetales bacterium]|nr:HAMP domain-containing histidine kinase [Planctomycetales bacterium]